MTFEQAEDILADVARHRKLIADAEERRKSFIAACTQQADSFFDKETSESRAELDLLIAKLHDFAEQNLPDDKKTIAFPNGRLTFRKEPPKFFFDDNTEVSGKDKRLVDFVQGGAPEFLKTVLYVDWAKFKPKLQIDSDGSVCYSNTGEILPNVHAEFAEDKFSVITP